MSANVQQLKGEWTGTCEVQWAKDDVTSTELNVTVKANDNGGVLFAYDSYARGKSVNGVSNWSVSGNTLTCNSYDARSDWQCNFSGTLASSVRTEQTLTGTSNNATYTQNIKFKTDGSCVIECFKTEGTSQQLVMRLTMTAWKKANLRRGAAYLDDAKLLAKVNVKVRRRLRRASNLASRRLKRSQ